MLFHVVPTDQNLVPKPAHQVEAQVHQRPGDAGAAVLLIAWYSGSKTLVHRWQIVVTSHWYLLADTKIAGNTAELNIYWVVTSDLPIDASLEAKTILQTIISIMG